MWSVIRLTSNSSSLRDDPVYVDPDQVALLVQNSTGVAPFTSVVIQSGTAANVREDADTINAMIEKAKADGHAK